MPGSRPGRNLISAIAISGVWICAALKWQGWISGEVISDRPIFEGWIFLNAIWKGPVIHGTKISGTLFPKELTCSGNSSFEPAGHAYALWRINARPRSDLPFTPHPFCFNSLSHLKRPPGLSFLALAYSLTPFTPQSYTAFPRISQGNLMNQPQNIIAIIYDFDHTLSPHYMQDHTILRHAELDPSTFWKSCTALIKEQGLRPGTGLYETDAGRTRHSDACRIRTSGTWATNCRFSQVSLHFSKNSMGC